MEVIVEYLLKWLPPTTMISYQPQSRHWQYYSINPNTIIKENKSMKGLFSILVVFAASEVPRTKLAAVKSLWQVAAILLIVRDCSWPQFGIKDENLSCLYKMVFKVNFDVKVSKYLWRHWVKISFGKVRNCEKIEVKYREAGRPHIRDFDGQCTFKLGQLV